MALKDRTGRPVSRDAYEEAVVAELRTHLALRLTAFENAGAVVLEPRELAGRMLAMVPDPAPNKMAELVGPFYDTARVVALLGISKQGVHDRIKRGSVLAMQTSDNVWVYPVFQFADRRIRPDLAPVLRTFRGQPAWSVAVWFATPTDDLEGASPEEWLRNGGDSALVQRLAGQAVGRWAA